MKISKADIRKTSRSVPEISFEDQALTSFSGVVVFQLLFDALNLKERLRACVRHLDSSASYAPWRVVLVLTVHLLLGWRRLRDLDYYRDDPMVLRLLEMERMPNVSTVSRSLSAMDDKVFERQIKLSGEIVLERVKEERLRTLTVDFDGSVLSTKSRGTEGTAVGFNRKAKGQRSYYPFFATLAQTAQVLNVLHRPGNVHDSNGAPRFVEETFEMLRNQGFRGILEARLDSAHFNDTTCFWLDEAGIEFSVSVPFERFAELKQRIENKKRWRTIDDEWSYFECSWKPNKWNRKLRCICYRHRVKTPRKGPIQLDLFEPISWDYEYKVVVTNKTISANGVLQFHNGRGSQEGIFAELKSQTNMDYIPTRRLNGNRVYLASAVLAHNLQRELQMRTKEKSRLKSSLKRATLWTFEKIDSFRKRVVQRAGRLTRPKGVLTLTMSANKATAIELTDLLEALEPAVV